MRSNKTMSAVITLQCGHFSNFIGAHLWNLQESSFEYDASSKDPREIITNVTFREGLTLSGEQTYTPRLIAIDLPGSLKSLKEEGELYHPPSQSSHQEASWSAGVDKQVREGVDKNEFLTHLEEVDSGKMAVEDVDSGRYDLQSSVEVWSDFLRLHLHPHSLLMVPGHAHPVSESGLSVYPAGLSVWENRKFRDSFEDKLHYFSEECDHLQGFQLLVDWDDGFGGVASCLAQELADEYSSKGLVTFLASPLTQSLDKLPEFRPTLLNHCLTLNTLCEHSSMVCPLSQLTNPWKAPHSGDNLRPLPGLNYEPSLPYHSSCVFGTALDTVSLLYRTEQSPAHLHTLTGTLTQAGRKVCGVGLSLPLSLPADSALLTELDHTPLHARLHPLTPFSDNNNLQRWSQAIAVRGIPSDYTLCSREDPRYLDTHRHPSHTLAHHLSEHFPSSDVSTQLCVVGKPLVIKSPYPRILPEEHHKKLQAPVCASFQCDPSLHSLLSTLTSDLRSTNVRRYPIFSTTCLDEDSCTELTHGLSALTKCYRTRPALDSGSTDSD